MSDDGDEEAFWAMVAEKLDPALESYEQKVRQMVAPSVSSGLCFTSYIEHLL